MEHVTVEIDARADAAPAQYVAAAGDRADPRRCFWRRGWDGVCL